MFDGRTFLKLSELCHEKLGLRACAPSVNTDTPVDLLNLVRAVFLCSIISKGSVHGLCGQQRFCSDCVLEQADLGFHWLHMISLMYVHMNFVKKQTK